MIVESGSRQKLLACPKKMAMITWGTNEKAPAGFRAGWREEETSMGKVAQRAAVVKPVAVKLAEIAVRITAHLRRFEADPIINRKPDGGAFSRRPFFLPAVRVEGNWIGIYYNTHRIRERLSKRAAIYYLAWLDAGNIGKYDEIPLEADQ